MKKLCTIIFLLLAFTSFSQTTEIYVSDAGNFNNPPWQILKFDANGQNPSLFINTNLSWPQDILFLEDSNIVLISNLSSNNITKHNATTGAYISDFATGISGPTRMKIGPDSLLYVLQWSGNSPVKRYSLNGSFVDNFTSVGLNQSIGLDWDLTGNLYVSSYLDALVRKFDTSGVDQGIFINSNLLGPTNIWFDDNGDLLVADYNGTAVKRFDSNGNYIADFLTGLGQCEGVAIYPNGNILIGNGATASVKLFDSTGTYIQDLIASGSGNLLTPNAVVIRNTGSTGITEPNETLFHIFQSNIGNQFQLNPKISGKLEFIEIFEIAGKFIQKEIKVDAIWDARNLAEGNYIVKATLKDGHTFSEKIIVNR